jgi:uridine kinase
MESDKTPLIRPFLLGVSGGTASGKTSVCKLILNKLGLDDCTIMSMDSFYKNPVYHSHQPPSWSNYEGLQL